MVKLSLKNLKSHLIIWDLMNAIIDFLKNWSALILSSFMKTKKKIKIKEKFC